jgi:hypothetical protein
MSAYLRLSVLVALISATGSMAAAPPHRDAKAVAVIEQSKAASGGAAWDRLEGSYEEGIHNGAPFRVWLDFRHYGRRVEGKRGADDMAMGYDGTTAWMKAGDQLQTMTEAASLSEARISAFVSNNGYFYPDRFPASAEYVREAKEDGRTFDVIQVAPEGARAVRLWFDRTTHLLARIEDFAGSPPVTVATSDYRPVGNVLIAFDGIITDASGKVVDRGKVMKVVHRPVDRRAFEPGGKGD